MKFYSLLLKKIVEISVIKHSYLKMIEMFKKGRVSQMQL